MYKINISDILVLNMLNKRPTYVRDPFNTFSNHSHGLEASEYHIRLIPVVEKLKKHKLIRENMPRELLPKLTVEELKYLLKHIDKPISGTKKVLINRIELFASDENLEIYKEKTFFVLTSEGQLVLQKYKNVLWIKAYYDSIYAFAPIELKKLDMLYFYKNLEAIPEREIINEYLDKDSLIVSNTYKIMEEYERAILYAIKWISEIVDEYIQYGDSKAIYKIPMSSYSIYEMKNDIMDNNEFIEVVENVYKCYFKNKGKISYTCFEEIIDTCFYNRGPEIIEKIDVFSGDSVEKKDIKISETKPLTREQLVEIESENWYEMLGSDFDFYLDVWLSVCSKMNDDELNEFKQKFKSI